MTPPVNTRRVMVRRHHGWEGASPALLAHVFGVSVQRATAITNERCAKCNQPICGHRDDEWAGDTWSSERAAARALTDAGIMPVSEYVRRFGADQHDSRPSISTGDRDGAGNARAASDVNAVTEREAMTAVKPGNVAPIPQDSLWQPVSA